MIKGWYMRGNKDSYKPIGYQYGMNTNHGRIILEVNSTLVKLELVSMDVVANTSIWEN